MEKFDHLYASIAQEVGGLEGLFNSMFSFLLRRTDFFYESDPGDNMGFPPGVNEKMLFKIFNQYRDVYYTSTPKKSVDEYAKKYIAYAKKNNLPLPKGMYDSEQQTKKIENKNNPPLKSNNPTVKSNNPAVNNLKKTETIKPKKKKEEKKKENKPIVKVEKPKDPLFTDIR